MFSYSKIVILMATLSLASAALGKHSNNTPFSFSVMSYNVENLFDTKNDPHKNDETFLPLSKKNSPEHRRKCAQIRNKRWRKQCLYWDWTEEVVAIKMKRLAAAIFAYAPNGPDIILLQEVENMDILEHFRKTHLKPAGYNHSIILRGQDQRGINVAILSRFHLIGEARLHRIPFSTRFSGRIAETREILEATLKLPNKQRAAVFVVHFPSPFHPFEMRREAMQHLNELAETARKSHDIVIAGGDFNITASEDSRLYRRKAGRYWYVSHHEGCKRCLGSAYYARDDSWSFLDAIMLLRQKETDGTRRYKIVPESIDVANLHPVQTAVNGSPHRFSFEAGQPVGVSDHWPIVLRIKEGHRR